MIRAATTQLARRAAPRAFQSRGFPSVHQFHVSSKREDESKPAAAATEAAAVKDAPKSGGWWDPMYSVPVGMAFAVPALHYEWYVVNEETLLAACFIAFCAVIQTQFGDVIKNALEEDGKRIIDQHNKQEDAVIRLIQDKIDDIQMQSRVVQDAEDIRALKVATYEKLNAAGKIKPQYDFKAQVERMLSIIEVEEVNLKEKAKRALMDDATAAVTAKFATSAELKQSSLASAIATLKGTKGGADAVQAAYVQFFQDKKAGASKIDEKAETAAARAAIVTKLNAVAKNEGFFFEFDAEGKPKMVV